MATVGVKGLIRLGEFTYQLLSRYFAAMFSASLTQHCRLGLPASQRDATVTPRLQNANKTRTRRNRCVELSAGIEHNQAVMESVFQIHLYMGSDVDSDCDSYVTVM